MGTVFSVCICRNCALIRLTLPSRLCTGIVEFLSGHRHISAMCGRVFHSSGPVRDTKRSGDSLTGAWGHSPEVADANAAELNRFVH